LASTASAPVTFAVIGYVPSWLVFVAVVAYSAATTSPSTAPVRTPVSTGLSSP
jgi:hypothetical protein